MLIEMENGGKASFTIRTGGSSVQDRSKAISSIYMNSFALQSKGMAKSQSLQDMNRSEVQKVTLKDERFHVSSINGDMLSKIPAQKEFLIKPFLFENPGVQKKRELLSDQAYNAENSLGAIINAKHEIKNDALVTKQVRRRVRGLFEEISKGIKVSVDYVLAKQIV